METKHCPICNTTKPLSEFYKHKNYSNIAYTEYDTITLKINKNDILVLKNIADIP